MCCDDPRVREVAGRMSRAVITYGFSEDADYRATDVSTDGFSTRFRAIRPDGYADLDVRLRMPGHHNVLNAMAAIAVATDEGVGDEDILRALAEFSGVGRRFQVYGDYPVAEGQVTLVDDYGHHPREVEAVIQGVRDAWPDRRLVMIYQPHRFSRTSDLYDDFVRVLSTVDVLLMLDVYPAGEQPIPGADSRSLCRSMRQRGQLDPVFVEDTDRVEDLLGNLLKPGDLLITQGAGDIGALSARLAANGLTGSGGGDQ